MRTALHTSLLVAVALAAAACGSVDPDPVAASTPGSVSSEAVTSTPTPIATPAAPSTPTPATTAPAADCSTRGADVTGADLDRLPAEVRETVTFLLDAASRCDEQLLATAATESDTSLGFDGAAPYEAFGLPDGDERYAALVTLLTDLPYAARADDTTPATFVWPRVATGDWQDDDTAWQEPVDAGLLSADEAAAMREAGSGYLGWRIGIRGDGTWMFLVAGD